MDWTKFFRVDTEEIRRETEEIRRETEEIRRETEEIRRETEEIRRENKNLLDELLSKPLTTRAKFLNYCLKNPGASCAKIYDV
jgi:FtsZ-binding cell division protein ZapB